MGSTTKVIVTKAISLFLLLLVVVTSVSAQTSRRKTTSRKLSHKSTSADDDDDGSKSKKCGKGSSKGSGKCGNVDCSDPRISGFSNSFPSSSCSYLGVCADKGTETCGCPDGTELLGGACLDLCETVADCNQDCITNEDCINGACECSSGFQNCRDRKRGDCIPDEDFFDDSNCGCDGEDCLSKGLVCENEFSSFRGQCVEPDTACVTDADCADEERCSGSVCVCDTGLLDCRNNKPGQCIPTTGISDENCGCDGIDCTKALEGSTCLYNNLCICPVGQKPYSGVCRDQCDQISMMISCETKDYCSWDATCTNPGPCFDAADQCLDDVGGTRYCRILSEFNETELFDLMEGDEWEEHLLTYEDKKDKQSSLGLCDHPGSKYRGLGGVTHQECFDPNNQVQPTSNLENGHASGSHHIDFVPWAIPSIDGGVELASNPGIWSFDDFITEEEEATLLALVEKYGYELNMYGPCKHAKRHPVNAHPSRGKICFMISPDNVCEGPYDISDCATKTHADDSEFVSYLLSKFKNMWSVPVEPYPYAKFQLSTGGTPPVDLHMDNEKSISFVLYLSDGGAKMIFPNANVTVTPKRRTAHTWLNMYSDGTRNPLSDHAVQAHPKDADERLVMLFEVPITPQKIIMASDKLNTIQNDMAVVDSIAL